jgi:DNA-binding protein HU-beta
MAKKITPSKPAPKAPAKSATAKPKQPSKVAAAKPAAQAPAPPPKPAVVTLKNLAVEFGASHDMPTKQAQGMLDGVVDMLVEHLKAGDKLRLSGLGILEVKDRPARTGRNPATGAPVQIAASKKIAFRPAKELKEAI